VITHVNRRASGFERCYCLAEVDIFADLAPAEMHTLAAGARMRTCAAGELLYSPQSPVEALFIVKRGGFASSVSPLTAACSPRGSSTRAPSSARSC
jgi:hypothetical protein